MYRTFQSVQIKTYIDCVGHSSLSYKHFIFYANVK